MQINITGHGISITEAIRTYATEKLTRLLERKSSHITSVNVIFESEKTKKVAKATLHLPPKTDIFASADSPDLYSAIDALIDKLNQQVTKHKDRKTDHHDHLVNE